MSNNISNYTRKQNIKNIIDKIITKTLDIILYPLRLAYSKYNGSELQSKRIAKKEYKKLKNNIYKILLDEDYVYITDLYVGQDGSYEIISIGEETTLQHYSGKSSKVIFTEIEDILNRDDNLLVERIGIRDLFKYSCYNEDGRVIKVMIVDKEDKWKWTLK